MSGSDSDQVRQTVLGAFAKQIGWCESLGSPFTARLLTILRDDIADGGASEELVRAWPGDPVAGALPLRIAGTLHALRLTESAPALVPCYPPSPTSMAQMRIVVLGAVQEHQSAIRTFLSSAPQTNEVGRSGVLIGGFLQIAKETGLPLRLLEIGASAGLNAIWDRYHYHLGAAGWGDPHSAVRIAPTWEGPPPPIDAPLQVIERHACDIAPIDLGDPAQRLRLRAYVWADQRERLSRLESAIDLARSYGPRVEQADAADWVKAKLREPAAGRATVLYHSIMWQYLPAETQADIRASLERAGDRATPAAPLAWLRFEPLRLDSQPELRMTLWPGAREVLLAVAHPHGSRVRWSSQ
ncbi:MAG TPA: DUF2332 family protein [Roseiarcus sp.]